MCIGQQDFMTVSNRIVSFQPSSASEPQCSEIQIIDDNILESTENFQVILDSSDRAVEIDPSTADINILDNDRKIKFLCGIIPCITDLVQYYILFLV